MWTEAITCFIVVLGIVCFKRWTWRRKKPNVDPNTVVLHQLPRGPEAPSISPFPLKLETWLRKNEIPYVNDFTQPFHGVTKKTPWIEYKGKSYADSQLCIEVLRKKLDLPYDPHLSDEERAVARAMLKMTEENLYWCACNTVFREDTSYMRLTLPYTGLKYVILSRLIGSKIRSEMQGHGIGRHSDDTILEIGRDDLKALSNYLGTKTFLMGDVVSEIDLAVFAMLVQIIYHLPNSRLHNEIKGSCTNLQFYVERIKKMYWPDWANCLRK